MKRWIFFTILSLGVSSSGMAETADPLCVPDPDQMPPSWRPSPELQKSLNPAPWSESETKDAEAAIKSGLDEMIGYFRQYPSAVQKLWDDSIEALIEVTYSSANPPEFDAKIRDAARENLTALLTPYLEDEPETAECDEFKHFLPLAIFAHRLYPAEHKLTNVVTKRVNAAYRDCGSLEAATEDIFQKVREDNQDPDEYIDHLEDLFDLYVWALWLIEAELYPDIELPDEARSFGQKAWKHFETLPLPNVDKFEEGIEDEKFVILADLVPHIAHIPTGVHRYPLYVEDYPDLYRYHRENFYAVMQLGEVDLFASFVDTLRQYGCTPENDVQVRDGTRFMLEIFHDNKDRWIDYDQENEADDDRDDYKIIHDPWTTVLGIRDRKLEQPKPGTYGALIRRWLPAPR